MPSANVIKKYIENSYYHVYNRGVEKRTIFLDEQDYKVFLSYLKFYLTLPLRGETPKFFPSQQLRNHAQQITILAYCLMPNHFHILLHQKNFNSMNFFMRSLCTRYAMYFNKRYERVGSLFQGPYKAIHIENERQFLNLSKYLHRNPLGLEGFDLPSKLPDYPFSSYQNYLGRINQTWVKPEEIISYFSTKNNNSYQAFIEDEESVKTELTSLGKLILDT